MPGPLARFNAFTDRLDPIKSDVLGPMVTKELWQGMRRRLFVGPFILLHVAAIVAVLIELGSGRKPNSDEFAGYLNLYHLIDSGPYWIVVGSVCAFLIPLTGLFLMQQELEDGNHELLQMTRLSRWSIVLGKFISLWGLSLLTLSSTLPYMILRYFQGGVDVGKNISLVFTVIGLSAIMSSFTIAASAFRHIVSRGIILILLTFWTFGLGCLGPIIAPLMVLGNGLVYHLNAAAATFCALSFGLGLARSRIRLKVHHFEVPPSNTLVVMAVLLPILVGILTAVSFGLAGGFGLVILGFIALKSDHTPKPNSLPYVPSREEGGTFLNTPNFQKAPERADDIR